MTTKHGRTALFLACCLFVLTTGNALAEGPRNNRSRPGRGRTQPSQQATYGSQGKDASQDNSCPQPAQYPTTGTSNLPASQFGGWTTQQNSCPQPTQCPDPTPAINTPAATAPSPTRAPESQVADGHYTIGSTTAQEKEAWNYINEDRQKQGLSQLPLDKALSSLARQKSQDMLSNNYFAHTSPTLGNAAAMLRNSGYSFSGVGENIARYGSVLKAHAGLMSSSGHRKNILGANWTRVGVGIALDKSGNVYMTQLFVR